MALPGPAGAGADDRGPLRAAFSGLTTRGRSFLAAGGAAAACAYLLGQSDLLRVGALLVALPLLCVVIVHQTRSRVAAARRLTPARVDAGTDARVHLRVENVARVPSGMLLLQDRLPYALGPRPRFVLDRIEPGERREVTYRVRSDQRGRYPIGPLQLRLADPFGMVELTRSFHSYDMMTVLPRVEPLPPVRLGGDAAGGDDGAGRTVAVSGADDIIPREYRHGDDLRRVHWRSTAHRGTLMVRREEQPVRAHCTILLDTRRVAYAGAGPGSPFERAVSGAASAVRHLVERDYVVRLVTETGLQLPGPETHASGGEVLDLIMDALALIDHSAETGLDGAGTALRGADSGLIVAFLGAVDRTQNEVLGRLRQRATGSVAFVAAGQVDPGLEATRLERLRASGWTALPLQPGVPLGQLWQQAAQELAVRGGGRS
ncbi:DUF58 domain-containing protein [Streptomyces sp. 7-21]|uniref:DUF58 domain-containing protein n=1 Tax=Streptomyces sp. 7-21 TaxID=2802283 RepID=UPI00191FECC7|nr:DUF58 domain-containing protein [Streptomyces sp. 7-21]MBL1066767.1 DUF58 domain-containing protein [Streptomyces sp. 7-21]